MSKKLVRLGDLGQVITGKTPPTKNTKHYGGDTPFLTPSDDMNGKFVKTTSRTLTTEGVCKVSKCLLPPGTICMSCIGSDLGKVVITKDPTVTNQQINSVIPDTSIVDPEYLYYCMLPLGRQLNSLSKTSTAVPIVNKTTFSNCEITLFDLKTQFDIGHILSALDEKIDINNQINDYLAEACEVIVMSSTSKADLVLSDISTQVTTKVPCGKASIESYVSTESLLPDKGGRQTASSLPETGKVTAYRPGDTLVSNIRPYFKKIWLADREGTCSGDVIVFRANSPYFAPYLYSTLRSDAFFEYVMAGAKGTKMPRGDKKQMMQFPIAADCSEIEMQTLSSMVARISANDRENVVLAELRDVLLPKLMSGEIDVSQIDFTQLNNHFALYCLY